MRGDISKRKAQKMTMTERKTVARVETENVSDYNGECCIICRGILTNLSQESELILKDETKYLINYCKYKKVKDLYNSPDLKYFIDDEQKNYTNILKICEENFENFDMHEVCTIIFFKKE